MTEQSMVRDINLDGTVLSTLTPNKEYNMVFSSSKLNKYSGFYRLARYFTTFNKDDGEWFSVSTQARLYGNGK